MGTFHPTTITALKAAWQDAAGPSVIDCDALKDTYRDSPANIGTVVVPTDRADLELLGRNLRLWTHAPAGDAALSFDGPVGASDCHQHVHGLVWRTNAARGARIRNATGWTSEGVEFQGADIGWAFGAVDGGQCEQLRLTDCAGTQIKHDSLMFEEGCSFNAARIDGFRFHHHENPDGGETAYAMRVLGNLYGSVVDIFGWQDDKEDDAGLTGGNKGIKVHASGSLSRSTVNLDAENGGSYLAKLEFPPIQFPWEGDDARRLMRLELDRLTVSGTWPYAYGIIIDGGPTAPHQWSETDGVPDPIEDWIDVSALRVTGGHLHSHNRPENAIVAITADGSIITPAGV